MTDEQQLQQEIIQCTGSSLVAQGDMVAFRQKLAQYINGLINHDFHTLISILYRLDINEKKLKELLAAQPAADAGELIAGMIIDRQLQKIILRKQFTQNPGAIAEEDKW
jgi:hypothetical protein